MTGYVHRKFLFLWRCRYDWRLWSLELLLSLQNCSIVCGKRLRVYLAYQRVFVMYQEWAVLSVCSVIVGGKPHLVSWKKPVGVHNADSNSFFLWVFHIYVYSICGILTYLASDLHITDCIEHLTCDNSLVKKNNQCLSQEVWRCVVGGVWCVRRLTIVPSHTSSV